jgi:hypothetical protein
MAFQIECALYESRSLHLGIRHREKPISKVDSFFGGHAFVGSFPVKSADRLLKRTQNPRRSGDALQSISSDMKVL